MAEIYAVSLAFAVAQGRPALRDGTVDEAVIRESLLGDQERVEVFTYLYDILEHVETGDAQSDLLRLRNKQTGRDVKVVNRAAIELTPRNYDYLGKIEFPDAPGFLHRYCDKLDGSDLVDGGEKLLLGHVLGSIGN